MNQSHSLHISPQWIIPEMHRLALWAHAFAQLVILRGLLAQWLNSLPNSFNESSSSWLSTKIKFNIHSARVSSPSKKISLTLSQIHFRLLPSENGARPTSLHNTNNKILKLGSATHKKYHSVHDTSYKSINFTFKAIQTNLYRDIYSMYIGNPKFSTKERNFKKFKPSTYTNLTNFTMNMFYAI